MEKMLAPEQSIYGSELDVDVGWISDSASTNKNTDIHHSQSIPMIVAGSLTPHDSSYQPLATALRNDDHRHSLGRFANPCFTGL